MTFALFSIQTLLICIAFFFAGIIDSVCGGGGMLTLPAFISVGFPVRMIAGTNQCSALGGSIVSLIRYIRGGRIDLRTVLPAVPASIIGSFLGARLNLYLPEEVLETVLIVLLPIIAVLLLIRRDFGSEDRSAGLSRRRVIINGMIVGLTVGAYQGFYGAGAGTFYLLGFAVLDRLDLITASGNMRAICLCSGITACAAYAFSGAVMWQVAGAAALFNIAGSYIGSGLALTKGAKVIRPMFLIILTALIIRLAISLIGT